MQPWIPPHWTALVIFYVISLHTVANHSDDNHYHTAVNIINRNVVNIIKCKLAPHTCTMYEDAGAALQQRQLARLTGGRSLHTDLNS